jgi:hypothetical protein
MSQIDPKSVSFPSLPIVTPDLPRRSRRDKYGGLFYLGITGLIVVVTLLSWFGYRMWSLRDVWTNIYVLHDADKPEEARVQAAFDLSRDPRVEQGQLWEMSLRRGLPDLARYILGEGVGADLVAENPWDYASAVALSPEWPGWLRLVLVRPLAYAATRGHAISRELLGELCRKNDPNDPIIRLWALYALAVENKPDPQTMIEIERVAGTEGPNRELAQLLLSAVHSDESKRVEILDQATLWLRTHHPEASRLWRGWTVHDRKLVHATSD